METIKVIKKLNRNMRMFLIVNLIECFVMGVFNTFVGIYLKEIGYGEHFVGYVLSINTLVIAFGSVFSAYFLEKIGRRYSFMMGFLFTALGSIGIIFVKSKILILIMSTLVGFGLSVRATAEGMFITENTEEEDRVAVFSLSYVIYNMGYVLATFLGGLISSFMAHYIDSKTAVQIIFLISTGMSLLAILPIALMKDPKNHIPRDMKGCMKAYKNIMKKNVIAFMIYYAIIGIGAGLVVPFFSIYLKYSMNISDAIVGTILSISQFGCIIGGMIIPFIVSKVGRARTVILCQLVSIPFLLSIMFPQGIIMITIAFFMRNGLMNMATPVIQNLEMELIEEDERTNLSSLAAVVQNLSRAIGITIGGFLMEQMSYNTPYFVTVLLYIVGVLIFRVIYKNDLISTRKINTSKK
ncbi:MFS transporter [Peptacetobacter sp.]|uniref:MFS transporter n=1 Tax=Peptacetobacter sp. TaxID=2991975 RepID=UPI0026134EA8|nr:MFS transporter [Peptacetobacter sp.]